MKQQNYVVGKMGEEIAAKHLRQKGYKILEKNWKTKFGELDLIASKNPPDGGQAILVFVEVKLKIGDDFGTPEEMITPRKLQQVQNTAISYLQQNPNIERMHSGYRIDAVCMVLDDNREIVRIHHYENINT